MATQTTYYNFNKPSGTDLVNPLVDTNPNWDIADAALHELNERSVANCTEVVSLGVHALSTLNTDTKFLKWIATANYTAGETFTLNGIAVAAATPSGASLATNAYVTGAVVMACLNADNSAMTVFLSGTNVAYDSERLGGELPSYYATDSDMDDVQNDIIGINNLLGNTSIVGIGDGTVTGAIASVNSKFTGRFSGLTLREETSVNVTFAAQLAEIEAAYALLTQEEKERAIIVRDDVIFTSDREGYFIAFRGNASNIQAYSYDISNKKYHIWTIATSGNSVADNSNTSTNIAMKLYA